MSKMRYSKKKKELERLGVKLPLRGERAIEGTTVRFLIPEDLAKAKDF